MKLAIAYIVGLIFGLGIAISGMGNPAKVLNFFDIFGTWDPSLIFVMGGGLIVTFIGYQVILKRSGPMFEGSFQIPAKRDLDKRLIIGSGLFGIGWGIAGFCPGAALPVLGTGNGDVFIFVASLLVGIVIAKTLLKPKAAA